VLLKFKLLEFGRVTQDEFVQWALNVPYMQRLHQRHGQGFAAREWIDALLAELEQGGALSRDGHWLVDAG